MRSQELPANPKIEMALAAFALARLTEWRQVMVAEGPESVAEERPEGT